MSSHWKIWIFWSLCIFGFLLMTSPAVNGEEDDSADEDSEDYADDQEGGDGLPPIITTKPEKFTLLEGSNVELKCQGDHFDNYGLFWINDGEILAAGEALASDDKRIQFFHLNGSLIIENLSTTDTGVYRCMLWPNVTVDHVVFVISEGSTKGIPHVMVSPTTLVVNQSEPVSLTCHSTGDPPPSVTWSHEGKKNFPSGETTIQGSTLTFASVTRHHTGKYDCTAHNGLGFATTSLRLEVNYPPEIEIERNSIHSRNGSEAELICIVHAEPKPKVTWYYNDDLIDFKKKQEHEEVIHNRHTLHIKNGEKETWGDYKCLAENKYGKTSGLIHLTGTPSQPKFVGGTPGEDLLSQKLTWKIESSIPIEGYRLSYKKGDGEWQNISTIKGEQESKQEFIYVVTHTLDKLVSDSDYYVTLSAMNTYGWSRPAPIEMFHINAKNFHSLDYQSETAKASVVAGGANGSSGIIISSKFFAWFLIIFMTMSSSFSWSWQ